MGMGILSMMINKKILGVSFQMFFLNFFPIFIITGICFADTLYLKDGRTIISETVWEKDGYYMYTLYGATVGISKNEVDNVEFSKEKEASFQFDIWPFGITTNRAIDIAEKNDVPLHKSGIITANKRFHPQVRKYSDATGFYYNTNLLGHFAKVELAFTPASKKLHTVTIQWSKLNSNDTKLTNEIESMISEKYGKQRNKGKKLFYSTTEWITEDKNRIEMKTSSTAILLSYMHTVFGQLDLKETENLKIQKIKDEAKKDNNKF
jgi:hypothetical protein